MTINAFDRLCSYLEHNYAAYKITEHAPVKDKADAAKLAIESPGQVIKALLLKADVNFALAVLPYEVQLASKPFKRIVGSQGLRFANAAELEETMGCTPGTCHPFGVINHLQTVMAIDLKDEDLVTFSSGSPVASITTTMSTYLELASPIIADIAKTSS